MLALVIRSCEVRGTLSPSCMLPQVFGNRYLEQICPSMVNEIWPGIYGNILSLGSTIVTNVALRLTRCFFSARFEGFVLFSVFFDLPTRVFQQRLTQGFGVSILDCFGGVSDLVRAFSTFKIPAGLSVNLRRAHSQTMVL